MKDLAIRAAIGALCASGLPSFTADAATVTITGTPINVQYGTSITRHEIVNGGLGVTAPSKFGVWKTDAKVTTTLPHYHVDWYYLGAESGWDISFFAAGSFLKKENDERLEFAGEYLGTSTTLDSMKFQPHGGKIAFAYLDVAPDLLSAVLSKTATDWFIFGYNDTGSSDKDYDDYVGFAHVHSTPLPGALPLMATGLGVSYLMSGWARRRRAHRQSPESPQLV
jgi:hypothetical protein